jgi:hypothetical protein
MTYIIAILALILLVGVVGAKLIAARRRKQGAEVRRPDKGDIYPLY